MHGTQSGLRLRSQALPLFWRRETRQVLARIALQLRGGRLGAEGLETLTKEENIYYVIIYYIINYIIAYISNLGVSQIDPETIWLCLFPGLSSRSSGETLMCLSLCFRQVRRITQGLRDPPLLPLIMPPPEV